MSVVDSVLFADRLEHLRLVGEAETKQEEHPLELAGSEMLNISVKSLVLANEPLNH
jgi:hypothetical protein